MRRPIGVEVGERLEDDRLQLLLLDPVGVAFVADAPWVLLPLPLVLAVMTWGVIRREERYMERRFGQDYRDFKARRRAWI